MIRRIIIEGDNLEISHEFDGLWVKTILPNSIDWLDLFDIKFLWTNRMNEILEIGMERYENIVREISRNYD